MGILGVCSGCSEPFSARNFGENYCDRCQQIIDESESAAQQAEEEAGAHADWEAQQAADAEADAWHSQYE